MPRTPHETRPPRRTWWSRLPPRRPVLTALLPMVLALVIVAELIVGGVLLNRPARLVPPRPRAEMFDAETTAALRQAGDDVRVDRPGDWAELGDLYLAHGYYPEAEACYGQACRLAPDDARLRGQWAFCLSRMGHLEEGLKEFRRAIEAGHPHPEELWYFAGRDYLRLERPNEARAAFERADVLPAARYELARLAHREGRAAEALPLLEQLQRDQPGTFAPLWLRARVEAALGRSDAAEAYDRRAAAAGQRLPTPFDAHSARVIRTHRQVGLASRWQHVKQLLDQERYGEAETLAEAGLRIQWSPEGADLLADAAHAQGQRERSRQLLAEIIRREGPSLHWLWRYGDACQELGQSETAYAAWRHALALGPESEAQGLYVKLSEYHAQRSETQQAERYKAAFYCAAGVDLLRQQDPNRAAASLREALAHDARNARAWFYLGESLQQLGQPEDARSAYRQCLALQPEHGRAWSRLAGSADGPDASVPPE